MTGRPSLAAALCAWACGAAVACRSSPPAEPSAPPVDRTTSTSTRAEASTPASPPAPIAEDGGRFHLGFTAIQTADPVHTTADLRGDERRWSYAVIVHVPSTKDSRFYRHNSMLDALFHPHDTPPSVAQIFSSPTQRLERRKGFIDYQLQAEASRALQARYGDFVVLVLDHEGRLLLESSEPIHRGQVHKAIGYQDGKPGPHERPEHDHPPLPKD